MIHTLKTKGIGPKKGTYRTEYYSEAGLCSEYGTPKYGERGPYHCRIVKDGVLLSAEETLAELDGFELPILPELPSKKIWLSKIKTAPNPDYAPAKLIYDQVMADYKQMLKDTFSLVGTFIYPSVKGGDYECRIDGELITDPELHWLYSDKGRKEIEQLVTPTEQIWDGLVNFTVKNTPENRIKILLGL